MDMTLSYDELVEIARRDDNIIGLILTGSRGRGFAVTDDSDWDIRLIVGDGVRDEYRARFATPRGSIVEAVVLSVTELEELERSERTPSGSLQLRPGGARRRQRRRPDREANHRKEQAGA